MKAQDIRNSFFEFFGSKDHTIVPSAPMTVKNDPTLMFTNAGMNQFKDIFLGNREPFAKRVADSQKCLRVSGKHNDLEEVGHDTYHHTMFEMLGNWSFGDYFKKDAINWGWEYLTELLKIDKDRLYVTIFQGDETEGLERDKEAYDFWAKNIPEEKILLGSKKDNFWEMGETGPCGPCSEIHVDIRDNADRAKTAGKDLVNTGHPLVIEIWNLVFIQYNRKADGSLELLPNKHVDTGMGFERLCMVLQGKKSNYDTDIFQSIIGEIANITGKKYGVNEKQDIAMRVIADHLRAVSFSIADGQLPSNNKAGYVIRRILRRAVRYAYTSLEVEEPLLCKLVPVLVDTMGYQYPELVSSQEYISKIILEEENAFLKTLGKGLKMIGKMIDQMKNEGTTVLPGNTAFELYDTYGFPVDLTSLILKENNMELDVKGFEEEMKGQKERSRNDAEQDTGDWIIVDDTKDTLFTGYDKVVDDVIITKYRTIKAKGRDICQLVFDKTPFYAEMGGQVGDTGYIQSATEKIHILNTVKENELIVHIAEKIPADPSAQFTASIDLDKRLMIANNHTATHLLHYALRSVLGKEVEQKGSLVNADKLRFDFSHFGKPSKEELKKIEEIANDMVRKGIEKMEYRDIPIAEAREMGAMALFGEKYGDSVRVIGFGDSVELCGGTHVDSTSSIGMIKIISEGAIATGIRRIEAITAKKTEEYVNGKIDTLDEIVLMLKGTANVTDALGKLIEENGNLKKRIEKFEAQAAYNTFKQLESKAITINDINFIKGETGADSADALKSIAFEARKNSKNTIMVVGANINGNASLAVMVSDDLVNNKGINAADIIKNISREINGGGGGQPFLASAGGKKPEGIPSALNKAEEYVKTISA
jgi:alanyl-tRNA synthetase